MSSNTNIQAYGSSASLGAWSSYAAPSTNTTNEVDFTDFQNRLRHERQQGIHPSIRPQFPSILRPLTAFSLSSLVLPPPIVSRPLCEIVSKGVVLSSSAPSRHLTGSRNTAVKKAPENKYKFELPTNIEAVSSAFLNEMRSIVSQLIDLDHTKPHFLRSLQVEAYQKLLDLLQIGRTEGYFNMATGSGKTLLFLLLAIKAAQVMSKMDAKEDRRKVLIIAPEVQVVDQTYSFMQELSSETGFDPASECVIVDYKDTPYKVFAGDAEAKENRQIVLMCSKSACYYFSQYPEEWSRFGLIIVDEFHDVNKQFLECMQKYSQRSGTVSLGFSATPNQRKVSFRNEIYRYNTQRGVDEGILAPWLVDTMTLPATKNGYDEFLDKHAVKFIQTCAHPHGGMLSKNSGIIYVSSIAKARQVAEALTAAGIPTEAIHSHLKYEEKQKVLKAFKARKVILTAVDMLKKGYDGAIDWAIIARNIHNATDFIQIRGRALRITRPEKIAQIYVFDKVKLPVDAHCINPGRNAPINSEYLNQLSSLIKPRRDYYSLAACPTINFMPQVGLKRGREEEDAFLDITERVE